MKKAFLYLLGIVLMATSCLDIADVYSRLDTLEQKVAALEELNTTVAGLSTSIGALKNNVYVKEVTETEEGYVIKFTDNTQAVIRDGVDGEDGTTPTIGVKEQDGELVWTVNGQVVKDESGKAVPATVKVPQFQFENNKWWYRFGPTDSWKDCGEKTGPEPSITETDEFVIITIGDKSIQIPKEVISPAIEAIKPVLITKNQLFIPVGESVDLKDFFEVEPEGALKSMVDYTPADDSPFTVSDKGVLSCTGSGNKSVTIASKANPDIKLSIIVRSAECPNNETPTTTIEPEQKIMIFAGSLDEFNASPNLGGSSNFNPINNSHTCAFNTTGDFNFRIGMPVVPNANLTMENARLHMWFYISDPSVLNPGPTDKIDNTHFLEITSSGVHDVDEVNFNLNTFVPGLKAGWNEVDLPFTQAGDLGGNFDITKTCFMRFVCTADTKGKWEAIQIRDYFIYAPDAPAQITIDGNVDDWASVKGLPGGEENTRIKEWKVAADDANLYFYFKIDASKIKVSSDSFDWDCYFYIGLDTDNNASTGANGGGGTSDGCEAQVCVFPWRGPASAYTWVNGVDNNGWVKCPISGESLANPTVYGFVDGGYGYLEMSVPKDKVGNPSGTIAVSSSMAWYATPRQEVAL